MSRDTPRPSPKLVRKLTHEQTIMNSTICPPSLHDDPLCFAHAPFPFYFSPKARLVDSVPDAVLTVAAPLPAYWILSLFFHFLDTSGWQWLEKYRIHESKEVKSRNLVTRSQVVWAVIFQQIVQTVLGLLWLSNEESIHTANHAQQLRSIAIALQPVAMLFGGDSHPVLLARMSGFVYWWAIPALQLLAAM